MKHLLVVLTNNRVNEKIRCIVPELSKYYKLSLYNIGEMSKNTKWYGDIDGYCHDPKEKNPKIYVNPYLTKAMNKQAKKVWQISNAFIIQEGEKLAKRLAQKTFANYVIFQNSGTEATEASIKVARRYFYSIGKPKKNRILCIKNSFLFLVLSICLISLGKRSIELPGFTNLVFLTFFKLYFVSLNNWSSVEALNLTRSLGISSNFSSISEYISLKESFAFS